MISFNSAMENGFTRYFRAPYSWAVLTAAGVLAVEKIMTGIWRRLASSLIFFRQEAPSVRGMFQSSNIISGREASDFKKLNSFSQVLHQVNVTVSFISFNVRENK